MMILSVLFALVLGAWSFSGFRAGYPKGRAIPGVLVASGAFLLWWVPMLYLELRGGMDSNPEFDIPIRRAALIGAICAIASVVVAGRNPTKSAWISTTRIVASGTIILGTMTALFAAP